MKIMLKLLLFLMLAGFTNFQLFAQQDVLSASADATGDGGTVSWSVGQVAYSAWSGADGSLTEGVQQPYEIFHIEGIQEFDSGPGCTVSPNPTTGKISMKFSDPDLKNLTFHIYDIEGISVYNAAIEDKEVSVNMDNLKPSSYFLVILKNDLPVKTYKIIKK